jgi:hypothetical protein
LRHVFRFPSEIKEAVRRHVRNALAIPIESFRQEPNYTAALAGRLLGVVYDEEKGYVKFHSTVVDDRGRGSAESRSGTDLVIIASISDERQRVEKAIIFQSKKGSVEDLHEDEFDRLHEQIRKMRKLTRSPKVLEIPDGLSKDHPTVVSANKVYFGQKYRPVKLEDYFVQRVLTTFDGDTRPDFISTVEESSFIKLKLLATIKGRP